MRPGSKHSDKATKHRLSVPTLNLRLVVDLLLAAFVIVYALVGMRNFELRMANLQEDDGPIFYAHAFRDPVLFEGDSAHGLPMSLLVPTKVITSAMIWIPALLWRYLDIDPYMTTWLITLVQGLSIGLSIYVLTLAIVHERVVAALATIFAYVAAPWSWNLANYQATSSWNFLPYPANLAIAPVMLVFACLIYGRDRATLLLLIVAGLIHPSLALYACAIVGIYWLWEGIHSRSTATLRRMAGLVLVGIITILPALFVKMTLAGDSLPRDEIIAGMRQNQHIWPWGKETVWSFSLPTTLKWLVLAILSLRWRAEFSREVQRLWLAAWVGVSAVSLSHVIGAVWQIPLLLNLIGLRSGMWLALISLPLVMYYWYAHIRSGRWLGAVLSMLCLAFPLYARECALFWPLIAGLLLVDASQGCLIAWKFSLPAWCRLGLQAIALCVLIAWSVFFLAMPFAPKVVPGSLLETLSQLTWSVLDPLPERAGRVTIVVAVALLGLMGWRLGQPRRTARAILPVGYPRVLFSALVSLTIVLYGAGFLWIKWQEAENERASSLSDMLEVQLWAREHTLPSALFVVPSGGGWRTMSLRRKLFPFTHEGYAYVSLSQAKGHRDRLLNFYGISAEEARELRGSRVRQLQDQRFWRFEENDFLRFASEFGAAYLVLPRYSWLPAYVLPLAYENPSYVVYRLEEFHFDKIYSLPFSWQGPDTIHIQDLPQTAPPLRISGQRGDFTFSRISVENRDVIRVAPVSSGANGSEERVVQFGWWLEDRGNGLEIPPGRTVVLSLRVQLSAPSERTELFIQDRTETWERSSIPVEGTSWQRYRVVREIRTGATEVILGVVWQPKSGEEWLEMRDMQVLVAPVVTFGGLR